MLLLALAAAIAGTQADTPPAEPRRQARATVRILSGAPVRFAEIEAERPKVLRSTVVRSTDGTTQPAKLLEFE